MSHRSIRIATRALLGLALVASFAGLALAASPHFVGRVTATLVGADVVVSFKEAGLGNNQLIDYLASANATAVYACQNNGGNFPSDPKKQEVSGPVTASGTFSSGKNGQVSASLTIQPPPSTLECPPGQNEVLVSVSYNNITITDTTNNVSETATPSSLSATFFDI